MGEALKAVPEIDGDAAERLYNYFRYGLYGLPPCWHSVWLYENGGPPHQ